MDREMPCFHDLLISLLFGPSQKPEPVVAVIDSTWKPIESEIHEVKGQQSVLIEIILQNQNKSHKLMEFRDSFPSDLSKKEKKHSRFLCFLAVVSGLFALSPVRFLK